MGSTVNSNELGQEWARGGRRWWQGRWELWKPSAVHPVLSAFLICVFSESALAKFSRKPSTKHSLGIQGTSLISLVTLTSQKFESREIRLSPLWSGAVGGVPNIFSEFSIQTGDCLPLLQPVPHWGASLALKAWWPNTSTCCYFLLPSGPLGFWSKVLSALKVGFLPDCQPEARQDLASCPKPAKSVTEFLGWGWPSISTEDLIGSTALPEMFSPDCQLHKNDSPLPLHHLAFYRLVMWYF